MWHKVRISFVVVLVALLLAACGASPRATLAAPPPASPAAATDAATPLPSATPLPPSPSPSPTALSPTPTPPLPLLPRNASFVWGKSLPKLKGNLDDPQALRDALRISLKYDSDVWIAAWPEKFPSGLPLPRQGWLLFASYSPYGARQGTWRLGFEIPTAAKAWQDEFLAVLEKSGWRRAPRHGPAEWGPSGGRWCSADLTWMLDVNATAVDDSHAVGIISFQSTEPEESDCAAPEVPLYGPAPDGFPTLKSPDGKADIYSGGRGGTGEWSVDGRVRSVDGISPLMQAFAQQLTAQGWKLQSVSTGGIGEEQAGFLRAHKEDKKWPQVAVVVLGKTPDFHVWVWAGKIPKAPVAFKEGFFPTLHGRLDDAAALRRALAVVQWFAYPTPSQNWVAVPPSPWPLKTLPKPKQARWKLAVHTVFPDGDDHWKLTFVVPESPEQARADLRSQLHSIGWTMLKTPEGGDTSLGFVPPPPPPEQQGDMFCYGSDTYLTASYTEFQGNGTLVSWEFSSQADICRYNHGIAPDVAPPFSGPHILLQVPQGDWLSSGSLIPSQLGFASGYVVTGAWWARRPLKDEIANFASQLQEQGWQVTGQNVLGRDAAWLHATLKNALFRWNADVFVGVIGDHYVYGVIWARRGK